MGTIAVVAIICFMLGRLYGMREASAIMRLRANRQAMIRQSRQLDRLNNRNQASRVRTNSR